MTKAKTDPSTPAPAAPRVPTPQERADELLRRWRLARVAGIPPQSRLEDHFNVTHSAFFDTRLGRDVPANSLIVKGEHRAADLLRRLAACGATDAAAKELSPAEHRAIVLARFPGLSK